MIWEEFESKDIGVKLCRFNEKERQGSGFWFTIEAIGLDESFRLEACSFRED